MLRELRTSATLFFVFMLVTGLGYPMLVLGIGQNLFPKQANGSLLTASGKIVGSTLIGQSFSGEKYFHPRPSAAGNGYDATNSSGSNLAPTSSDLMKAVADRVTELKKTGNPSPIPVDLVTTSASGLDPHISVAAARFQSPRIIMTRHLNAAQIEDLISQHTESRTLGFLGENRVNVLELNLALDHLADQPPSSIP